MSIVIDDIGLTAFLQDPAGGVATYMRNSIVPPTLDLARLTISRDFPGHGPRGTRFPPPGPPYKRTGNLVRSLIVVEAAGASGVEFFIVPTAEKDGFNYGLRLKGRTYEFMPPEYYA